MNVKNNKRRRESIEKIEKAFMEMLMEKDISEISVTDICTITELNRSTFYANFDDIYALADSLRIKLEADFNAQFEAEQSRDALQMFRHIYENQLFYKAYFKLGYDESHKVYVYDIPRAEKDFENKHIKYHIEFFRSGFNAMVKLWLNTGCKETPEEMSEILKAEYKGR